ncbi:uncharacterized protein [Eurosta solidaginis]|uniref:uncharacterized protein isoform X1 n=1 Tax=Eurosta solidaginis TaxID=178769 RepID=UPI0035310284
MEENTKQKSKRRRVNPSHRWTESENMDLIEAVADATRGRPESFEKPTAERFYTRIKSMASSLRQIEWMSLKCKMRYLKASYVSALDWKNKTGSGLLASGDESSVTAYIQKICPNFDMLADIFGQRKNVSPPFIFDSQIDTQMTIDHSYLISYVTDTEPEQDYVFEPVARSQTSTPEPLCLQSSVDLTQHKQNRMCNAKPVNTQHSTFEHKLPQTRTLSPIQQRKNKRKKMPTTNTFNDLLLIQEKKLELEVQKLELEREREKNKVQLKELELKNQIELRKMEL